MRQFSGQCEAKAAGQLWMNPGRMCSGCSACQALLYPACSPSLIQRGGGPSLNHWSRVGQCDVNAETDGPGCALRSTAASPHLPCFSAGSCASHRAQAASLENLPLPAPQMSMGVQPRPLR